MSRMFGKRPDGVLVRDVPAYRRIMPYIMKGPNGSVVYFDLPVDVSETNRVIEQFNAAHPERKITLFHLVLWAAVQTLHEKSRLNRFVAGGRLWQRDGIWISYSVKKKLAEDAPVVVLKRRFDPAESFRQLVEGYYAGLQAGRSEKKSRVDKELSLALRLPPAGLEGFVRLERRLDALGLLPKSYIDGDPLFASLLIANLASLKMDSGFHHLYDYGNIPVFCVIGKITDEAVAVDGKLVVRPRAHLRFSFDERVEDGLYAQRALELLKQRVEDPRAHGVGI
jgi:hypothetical protein